MPKATTSKVVNNSKPPTQNHETTLNASPSFAVRITCERSLTTTQTAKVKYP
jgi:hypothetical protein